MRGSGRSATIGRAGRERNPAHAATHHQCTIALRTRHMEWAASHKCSAIFIGMPGHPRVKPYGMLVALESTMKRAPAR
jgi:hypothetical protein